MSLAIAEVDYSTFLKLRSRPVLHQFGLSQLSFRRSKALSSPWTSRRCAPARPPRLLRILTSRYNMVRLLLHAHRRLQSISSIPPLPPIA